jgi:hypothetical protein
VTSKEARRGLAEEQAAFGAVADDDGMVDIADLSTRRAGIAGRIFLPQRRPSHGPRFQWCPGRPEWDRPFAREGEAIALPGVERNRAALLRFGHEGPGRDPDEVRAFIDGPAKLP